VEYQEGAVFFALNIDTPRRLADLAARQKVVGDVLRSMGLLRPD
jgi:beta-lactamase class D